MTCKEFREELELYVGQNDLSDELQQHLATCPTCATYRQELNRLAGGLASDGEFYPSEVEASLIQSGVARRLKSAERTEVTSLHWLRYAAVAASVILVAAIGYVGHRYQISPTATTGQDSVAVAQVNPTGASGAVNELIKVSNEDVSDVDVSSIESNLSGDLVSGKSDVLENLSEDELQYLEKNLDVKDLL